MSISDILNAGLRNNPSVMRSLKAITDGMQMHDIFASKKAITVYIEIPGLIPGSININFSGSTMTVSADKKQHITVGKCLRRDHSTFYTSARITLPLAISSVNIVNVEYTDGVITVRIGIDQLTNGSFNVQVGNKTQQLLK